ncbi:MAG TPA: hypothetical protein VK422_08790 [Pyrinomonadaceae bacterium]|nr:hypothetical protein [Pyrinomonadaceae bacterium]
MDIGLLESKFARMGARLKVTEAGRSWDSRGSAGIDIRSDGGGEFFEIRLGAAERVEYEVVDLRPDLKHLLLLGRAGEEKRKFLCGHDERHWFVCAVPGKSVSGVLTAFRALQPALVRHSAHVNLKRRKNLFRRRNEAYVRQGEWFFVPAPELKVDESRVLRNEPLTRGGGSKAHVCQYAYRTGGRFVMVCEQYPRGVGEQEYRHLLRTNPQAGGWRWRSMVRDPRLFVRGSVRHADHKTVVLDCWHRVSMNTEGMAVWASSVVFLD